MENTGHVVKELVGFVREQRDFNRELKETHQELKEANLRLEESAARMDSFHREEMREHRREHKAGEQRWQRMFQDHERWMRGYDVRITEQHRQLLKLRDRLP